MTKQERDEVRAAVCGEIEWPVRVMHRDELVPLLDAADRCAELEAEAARLRKKLGEILIAHDDLMTALLSKDEDELSDKEVALDRLISRVRLALLKEDDR